MVTVTMPSLRVTLMVSTSGDDTEVMGYNPNRKHVPKRGDLALVAIALIVALALVVWAFAG